jgi:hypothetical protein
MGGPDDKRAAYQRPLFAFFLPKAMFRERDAAIGVPILLG